MSPPTFQEAGPSPAVSIGREVVLVLLESYQSAIRQETMQVGTELVLRMVARGVYAGERGNVPDSIARIIEAAGKRIVPGQQNISEAAMPALDEALPEVDATLRDVSWRAFYQLQRRTNCSSMPGWTDAMHAALGNAIEMARSVNAPYVGVTHLLAGLVADERTRASALMRAVGMDSAAVADAVRSAVHARRAIEPYTPLVASLELAGGIEVAKPRLVWLAQTLLRRRIGQKSQYRSPILVCLELEMMRQTVRVGSTTVTPGHALLSIVSLDSQLALSGKKLAARSIPFNKGAAILRGTGIDLTGMTSALVGWPVAVNVTRAADSSRRAWPLAHPDWGLETSACLDRSVEIMREHDHPETGTTHLLRALIENEDGAAGSLLRALGVDYANIRDRVELSLSSARAASDARRQPDIS